MTKTTKNRLRKSSKPMHFKVPIQARFYTHDRGTGQPNIIKKIVKE